MRCFIRKVKRKLIVFSGGLCKTSRVIFGGIVMNSELRLFFKSRYYRKARLLTLKPIIIGWIKYPFLCIKAVSKVIKIIIDNPNRWDRYLKFKEIEHNNKIEEERQENTILRIKFIGEIFRLSTCTFAHCSDDTTNTAEEDNKTVQDEFNEIRENIKNQIREFEKRDIVVPNKLKTIIEETNLDNFTDLDDCQEFHQKLKSILHEMFGWE